MGVVVLAHQLPGNSGWWTGGALAVAAVGAGAAALARGVRSGRPPGAWIPCRLHSASTRHPEPGVTVGGSMRSVNGGLDEEHDASRGGPGDRWRAWIGWSRGGRAGPRGWGAVRQPNGGRGQPGSGVARRRRHGAGNGRRRRHGAGERRRPR
jgi:hypothetical protein